MKLKRYALPESLQEQALVLIPNAKELINDAPTNSKYELFIKPFRQPMKKILEVEMDINSVKEYSFLNQLKLNIQCFCIRKHSKINLGYNFYEKFSSVIKDAMAIQKNHINNFMEWR